MEILDQKKRSERREDVPAAAGEEGEDVEDPVALSKLRLAARRQLVSS